MHNMLRTTIVAEDEVLLRLRSMAQKLGVPVSEVVRRALREYIRRAEPAKKKLSILGVGSSGGGLRISERDEELLFAREKPAKRSKS